MNISEKFDIIILDLLKPISGTPCDCLYIKEFYLQIQNVLNPEGIKSLCVGRITSPKIDNFCEVIYNLNKAFKNVILLVKMIVTYGELWDSQLQEII